MATQQVVAEDAKKMTEELLRIDQQFSDMSVAKGVKAAFLAYLAPNAKFLGHKRQPINGREAIADFYGSDDPKAILIWKPRGGRVAASGDLGYTWGTWEYTPAPDPSGKPVEKAYGKYVDIWERQPDGQWKIILDTGNASPGPLPE